MKKYRRNRLKDAVIVTTWLIAVLPIFPVALIIALHDHVEKFADWYDDLALSQSANGATNGIQSKRTNACKSTWLKMPVAFLYQCSNTIYPA